MYPFIRMTKDYLKARKASELGPLDTHVSHHICWPWDLDFWMELNNGRTLTLYDLGRIAAGQRVGLFRVLAAERWGLTVAGSAVRYRRRVRVFDKIEVHTRLLGWDHRFVYMDQSMWKSNGDCSSHAVLRTAITGKDGIVTPARVMAKLGHDAPSPDLPPWVDTWLEAEDQRPWPPLRPGSSSETKACQTAA